MPLSDWNCYFQSAGQQYGVDPDLLRAIATVESGGNRNAISRVGATGPMQFMPDTAKALGITDPTDPAQAIPAAAKLLTQSDQQLGGAANAVLAYHGGTDRANWGPKTHAYLAKVNDTYQQLKNGSPMASTSQPQSDDAFSAAFGPAPSAPAVSAAPVGPDAFSVAFGQGGGGSGKNAPTVKPSVPTQPWGFKDQVMASVPFAKDVIAGGGAALDSAANALSGKSGASFGDTYRANVGQLDAQQTQYAKDHPFLSPLAGLTSVAVAGKPSVTAVTQIASLPARVWNGVKSGATLGGLFGAGQSDDLVNRPENALIGAATGATLMGALPVVGAVVRPVVKAAGSAAGALAAKAGLTVPDFQAQATNKLLNALDRDQVSAGDVATGLTGSGGKPLTAMDLAGTNTQRLARNLVTQPGEAGDKVTSFLQNRSADQGGRVLGDITNHLSNNTDVYGTAADLVKQRSEAAAPLYETAFAGGSTAPLADQFASELQKATSAKGTIASQIKSIEQNNPGALAARGAAGADTRSKYMDLRNQLAQAEQNRQAALSVFQKAKADGSANAPGAVWSPRIQQFLDDPIIKQGIAKGLEVQRLEALAEGKPFNPTEYAVVGNNPDGTPKIGSVPNMRLLDAAKRGLDDTLEGYRDGTTGKLNLDQRGRAIDQVRKSLISELDSINSSYKQARAAWAGPSQSNTAMTMGDKFMNADPEQIQQAYSRLSDSDKDFYRVGAARALQDRANSASDSADLSKRMFGNARVRQQIETVFGPGSADAFGQAMGAEGKMASTNRFVLGGSNTANKIADAADAHHELAQDILHGGLQGGPSGAIVMPALKAVGRGINNLFAGTHPVVANHLASALTASGQSATHIYEQLAAEQAARRAAVLRAQARGAATNRLFSGGAGLAVSNGLASPQ